MYLTFANVFPPFILKSPFIKRLRRLEVKLSIQCLKNNLRYCSLLSKNLVHRAKTSVSALHPLQQCEFRTKKDSSVTQCGPLQAQGRVSGFGGGVSDFPLFYGWFPGASQDILNVASHVYCNRCKSSQAQNTSSLRLLRLIIMIDSHKYLAQRL